MCNKPIRMRQLPSRESVRRKSLMHKRHSRPHPRIRQIRIIGPQLLGKKQSPYKREYGKTKKRNKTPPHHSRHPPPHPGDGMLNHLTGDIQTAFKSVPQGARPGRNKNLPNHRRTSGDLIINRVALNRHLRQPKQSIPSSAKTRSTQATTRPRRPSSSAKTSSRPHNRSRHQPAAGKSGLKARKKESGN